MAEPEEAPEIPAELVGELELPLRADQDCVQARLPELRAYALGLERYRRNPDEATTEDSLLLQTLSDLRGALEDIYGQRFTFQGEQRAESGPFSEQRYGKIAGEVTGMEAANAIRGPATSRSQLIRWNAEEGLWVCGPATSVMVAELPFCPSFRPRES